MAGEVASSIDISFHCPTFDWQSQMEGIQFLRTFGQALCYVLPFSGAGYDAESVGSYLRPSINLPTIGKFLDPHALLGSRRLAMASRIDWFCPAFTKCGYFGGMRGSVIP